MVSCSKGVFLKYKQFLTVTRIGHFVSGLTDQPLPDPVQKADPFRAARADLKVRPVSLLDVGLKGGPDKSSSSSL